MRWPVAILLAAVFVPTALAGAWPQPKGHGLSISQAGYAFAEDGGNKTLASTFAEFGLGADVTALGLFEGDMTPEQGQSVWRAGAGLRYSFEVGGLDEWHFGVEAMGRYQSHAAVIADPVFAGDGAGWSLRGDVGRGFELFGLHGYADLSLGYVERAQAPGEQKLELVAGLDLSPTWQVEAGYFGSRAPGKATEPGAYEKHEVEMSLRWRFSDEYAVAVSVWQTVASERTPRETTLRLALWSFWAPD